MTEQTDVQISAVGEVVVEGQPVMTIEGELITAMEAKLPSVTVVLPEGYKRGTHLRMNVEFVVKKWGVEERKGENVRVHTLALESAQMVAAFRPEEAHDGVGGSASGTPAQTPEQAEELGGLQFGRTSDTWDHPQSA